MLAISLSFAFQGRSPGGSGETLRYVGAPCRFSDSKSFTVLLEGARSAKRRSQSVKGSSSESTSAFTSFSLEEKSGSVKGFPRETQTNNPAAPAVAREARSVAISEPATKKFAAMMGIIIPPTSAAVIIMGTATLKYSRLPTVAAMAKDHQAAILPTIKVGVSASKPKTPAATNGNHFSNFSSSESDRRRRALLMIRARHLGPAMHMQLPRANRWRSGKT